MSKIIILMLLLFLVGCSKTNYLNSDKPQQYQGGSCGVSGPQNQEICKIIEGIKYCKVVEGL